MALFKQKSIVKVEFLGITTGFQTKILATYNFPVYNFLIYYDDGSTTTKEIAAENSYKKAEIDKLLKLSKSNNTTNEDSENPITPKPSFRDKSAIYDDLKKLKDLFDTGVLTNEMYESEKKSLFDELTNAQSSESNSESVIQNNVIIERRNPRGWGEAKTILHLDSIAKNDIDLDSVVKLSLTPGTHNIFFSRAALKSQTYTIHVSMDKVTHIYFTPKNFGIKVEIC